MPRSNSHPRSAWVLLTLLGVGCAGPSRPVPQSAELTVEASNAPADGNIPITCSLVNSGDFVPLSLGASVVLPPGRYVITSRSQIRDGHKLFRVAVPAPEVVLEPGMRYVHTIAYTHEELPPATLTYEVSGLPAATAPRVFRTLPLPSNDAAVVLDSLPADQAQVPVPAAAGTWTFLGGLVTLDGRTYSIAYDQSQVTLAPGGTAAIAVTYTLVP